VITRGCRSIVTAGMAALLLSSGCARHVTKSPETVARLNDGAWTIRRRPPAPPTPVAPLPLRQRPEVQLALRSKEDALGIPRDLSTIDPLLSAYRRDMDAQASARAKVGTGVLVLGLICGGVAGWSLSYALDNSDSFDAQTREAAARLSFWGTALAILAAGEIAAGVTLLARSSNDAPLRSYYRETYGERP
jgi:hypothetical protein